MTLNTHKYITLPPPPVLRLSHGKLGEAPINRRLSVHRTSTFGTHNVDFLYTQRRLFCRTTSTSVSKKRRFSNRESSKRLLFKLPKSFNFQTCSVYLAKIFLQRQRSVQQQQQPDRFLCRVSLMKNLTFYRRTLKLDQTKIRQRPYLITAMGSTVPQTTKIRKCQFIDHNCQQENYPIIPGTIKCPCDLEI